MSIAINVNKKRNIKVGCKRRKNKKEWIKQKENVMKSSTVDESEARKHGQPDGWQQCYRIDGCSSSNWRIGSKRRWTARDWEPSRVEYTLYSFIPTLLLNSEANITNLLLISRMGQLLLNTNRIFNIQRLKHHSFAIQIKHKGLCISYSHIRNETMLIIIIS